MKVYITGSTGTIGSNFTNVIKLNINLLDSKTFPTFSRDDSATIIHLAGIVGTQHISQDMQKAKAVNIDGTLKFAENILTYDNLRFIYVSSSHVYKNSPVKHQETEELDPINHYGEQKLVVEKKLSQLYESNKSRLVIARVFSILGPNMKPGTLGHAIENIDSENPLKYSDDIRDFLTPKQAAQFLFLLAQSKLEYDIYNVCSGNAQTVRSAAMNYRSELGLSIDLNLLRSGNSYLPIIRGDNTRLLRLIAS